MQIAPILPPMKPSTPAASNRADGAQHTAYRVPEAMFKLRLLTRNINDDAENLLTLNKKIGQVLIRFFSEMQSVQRMANAEFADEEYAETVARALESTIEKLDNNTYWSLLRTLTLMSKIDAVRAGLGTDEMLPPDEICTQLYRKIARETHAFDAFVEGNMLLVRMPMLPSIRAHGVINSGQKRAIFDTPMFVETVRGSVLSVKEKLPKIAKKCITYLFIYRDAAAPHLDSDNHNTKSITDVICSYFEAGDDGFYADFRFFTRTSELLPAGTYITVSAMDGALPTPEHITRTCIFCHNRPEISNVTKTAAGHRNIPIPVPLFNHLKGIKKSVASDFVICNSSGLPLSETQFRNMWRKIKRRSVGPDEYIRYKQHGKKSHSVNREAGRTAAHNPNVRYIIDFPVKTHMLRKTYITNLIYSGVDVRTVMDYAGHKNPDVTLKIYAQAKSAEKRTESAKQINEVFPSDPTT